uniref:Uncharacterized protein LOC111112893 n=1 Tax=Crassostrea virginica TaxID=6565 RepID=A0A8B8BU86_CRAVI|nr:uncharacterized protein LOC111112893 [Crassostrea virginica]
MERVICTCFVVCGLLSIVQGGSLIISEKFMNGDVLFLWNGDIAQEYDIQITRDKTLSDWDRQTVTQYTVEDALLYDSIGIDVRLPGDSSNNKMMYSVSKVESNVGDSVNISWTAPFFPRAGAYTVYHTGNVNRSIIVVTSSGSTFDQTKYEYQSRPFDSTNINFTIKDVSRTDAGYYNGGLSPEAAWSGGGVVLIVHDKPSKPKIQGNLNIMVDSYSNLTCSSFSNTAPEYYARLHPLSYTWYVNNTKLSETRETLMLRVFRDHKYNNYSCTAKAKLNSDRSDPVIINPMYTPDKLTILPEPLLNSDDKLAVKEGETIGPYTCTADCNPPCDITWKYKDSTSGGFFDVASTGSLDSQIANRSIGLYRCISKFLPDSSFKKIESIRLDVLYLDKPLVSISINGSTYSNQAVQAQERTTLHISCNVRGNPYPSIRLQRSGSTDILKETSATEVLSYSITRLQCYDTGYYTCSGESTGFDSKERIFMVNINCRPMFDYMDGFKTRYGSKSGDSMYVPVSVPIIANPPPKESDITWSGPTGQLAICSNVLQQNVIYKHLVKSFIPIKDRNFFGNYTLKYERESLITVTISAEELRINKSDQTEINNGGLIGLEGTVVVKVPIISDSLPLTSHITWLNPNGLMFSDKSIVLQQTDGLYNYLITSILPVSGAKQFGEYRMLYDGNLIATIIIKEKDINMSPSAVLRKGNYSLSTMGLLISTILLSVLGTVFLGIIIYHLYSRRKQANRKNDENSIGTAFYATQPNEQTYQNENKTEEHIYSAIDLQQE